MMDIDATMKNNYVVEVLPRDLEEKLKKNIYERINRRLKEITICTINSFQEFAAAQETLNIEIIIKKETP